MTLEPGDRVHLPGLGTGIVREVRSRQRYLVEIKHRAFIVDGGELEAVDDLRQKASRKADLPASAPSAHSATRVGASLDLHGKTVVEAAETLDVFINDALVAGHHTVHIIHGRSGGRVKSAVHQYLRRLGSHVRFRVDPRNAGVTIVSFDE